PVLALRKLCFRHGQLGENLMRRAIEQLALLGEYQSARVTVEQRNRNALFERADLAADRRLAEIQGPTGMGEAPRFGDSVEYAQLVPIHHSAATLFAPPFSSAALLSGVAAPIEPVSARKRSASSAAMQPMPAAVTAWRKIRSFTSPAAKTPGMAVAVLSG